MNITLSVDESIVRRARDAAQQMGKSLDEVVHEHLVQLAGNARSGLHWTPYDEHCLRSQSRLGSWHFRREDAFER